MVQEASAGVSVAIVAPGAGERGGVAAVGAVRAAGVGHQAEHRPADREGVHGTRRGADGRVSLPRVAERIVANVRMQRCFCTQPRHD